MLLKDRLKMKWLYWVYCFVCFFPCVIRLIQPFYCTIQIIIKRDRHMTAYTMMAEVKLSTIIWNQHNPSNIVSGPLDLCQFNEIILSVVWMEVNWYRSKFWNSIILLHNNYYDGSLVWVRLIDIVLILQTIN